MLNCREITQQASAYLDNRDEPERKPDLQFRLHLMLCRHCRRFIRQLHSARVLAAKVQSEQQRTEQGDQTLARLKRRN
ncbi:zf-HC2 domain-containing protein [Gilvimarinus polysaccharolyticus]|uniref:zf-HC2 domain-containing protein n=1 Tax=Gilvimarinus polysaccharolyticus TaxID=863921 RepID=UPI000673732F|nr:zf-HC2 domain-containing protein [Gilvimarinus polysaccharolyticus]